MARPISAASTSHSRAWVSSGGDVVAQHVAVVVEAVDGAGQLTHPGGDAVRGAVGAGRGQHVGQRGQAAQHVELALVDEQAQVDLAEGEPVDPDARRPRA